MAGEKISSPYDKDHLITFQLPSNFSHIASVKLGSDNYLLWRAQRHPHHHQFLLKLKQTHNTFNGVALINFYSVLFFLHFLNPSLHSLSLLARPKNFGSLSTPCLPSNPKLKSSKFVTNSPTSKRVRYQWQNTIAKSAFYRTP